MRGQVAMEFMTVFLLILVLFVILQVSFSFTALSIQDQRASINAEKIAKETAMMLRSVGRSEGLIGQFVLPIALRGGYPYSLGVSNASVYVTWNSSKGGQSVVESLHVFNVTNSTGATAFNLGSGTHHAVKHENGVTIT